MSHQTPQDITITITVPSPSSSNSTSKPLVRTERRITPTWTVSQLKLKLEPITGIPSSSQSLHLLTSHSSTATPLTPDTAPLDSPTFNIYSAVEIQVVDLRPPGMRQDFSDTTQVEKYEMPKTQYEGLSDSVLAWKKRQQLGRFDPHAKTPEEAAAERRNLDGEEIARKGVQVGRRCRVGGADERRGTVRFVGEIGGLGGERERGCVWVGVELDEPVGRNDGSVKVESAEGGQEVKRVFECKDKFGVFARPEKIEIGDFPALDDLDEDMEEI